MYYLSIQSKIGIDFLALIKKVKSHKNNEAIITKIESRSVNGMVKCLIFHMNYNDDKIYFKIYRCGLIQVINKTINNYVEVLSNIIQILDLGKIGQVYNVRCSERFLNSNKQLDIRQNDLPSIYYNIANTTD
ncbi:hypothetical protein QJ854_gp135 [Moumouvirus goulette]|uniref:Uncharacterized protein n=1 Tax=Moumouvirus goulette TaxID=1247379 RepID=M1PXY6_9VIRU|nr:hypothetical protein QJ854_gp135 [Moumouvirus goulette]AGF85647.1 hypothetical protein glt_00842 [Moumouvirus goulette]